MMLRGIIIAGFPDFKAARRTIKQSYRQYLPPLKHNKLVFYQRNMLVYVQHNMLVYVQQEKLVKARIGAPHA
jgi:hypothetical protein